MSQRSLFGPLSRLNITPMSLVVEQTAAQSVPSNKGGHGFYEFFAGSGMVRIGLGPEWNCLIANDFDPAKCASYMANFDSEELIEGDIAKIAIEDIPIGAKLAWASFPCQDLSLAGSRNGLNGNRSGTFWAFWNHVKGLEARGNKVPIIALENVVGLLSSAGGEDFKSLVKTLSFSYQVGAVVMDAVHWLPQSRPRLFVVAVSKDLEIPKHLVRDTPRTPWHNTAIQRVYHSLDADIQEAWLWFDLPSPQPRTATLQDLIEREPRGVKWNTQEATNRLLAMMSPANLAKVDEARKQGHEIVGTIYKRTRPNLEGGRDQRAEVRFDGVSGCLRTPSGGSSRQTILVVNGDDVRSRLLSPREAARLMGLPDSYILPPNYNDAYHLAGDGVAVPAVEWLQRHLLTPLAEGCP